MNFSAYTLIIIFSLFFKHMPNQPHVCFLGQDAVNYWRVVNWEGANDSMSIV